MSRLAKKRILIPQGVTAVALDGGVLIKGAKAEKKIGTMARVTVRIEEGAIFVALTDSTIAARSNAGTMWSLIRSALHGVAEGFSKTLEIEGVGYRAVVEGDTLALHLGYVHPIRFKIPQGVTVATEKSLIKVSGTDKDLVGRTAARIRAFKKPEPYKGKGIRYQGEIVRRKVGKKAAAAGAAA